MTPHLRPSEDNDPLQVPRLMKPFDVQVTLPGSKSLTLRHLVLSALAEGDSLIRAPGECDDMWRMEAALVELGIGIARPHRHQLRVRGRGGKFDAGARLLDCGLSGATARFMLAVSALRNDDTTLDGHPGLRKRPQKQLLDALRDLGAVVTSTEDGQLPARLRGPLTGDRVRMQGGVSSQYFSALLQIAPLLPRGLTIEVEGELVSQAYVAITLAEMAKFGVHATHDDFRRFEVPPGRYQGTTLTVEGDASAASYFMALATIHGSRVTLDNLGTDTLQGDYAFASLCERLGAKVERSATRTVIQGPPGGVMQPLTDEIDMGPMPDVAPTLIAIAPLIGGNTVLTGLSTLRVKECDRIAVPAANLKKLGVPVVEGPDFIEVGDLPYKTSGAEVGMETRDDHRMAMSFAVLGTRLGRLRIRDPRCVDKTYPGFWEDLRPFYAG